MTRVLNRPKVAPAASLVALALALQGGSARAQEGSPEARAQELFVAGQSLLKDGRLDEACPLLAESQRLDPALGTLLNLAVCHEKQGKVASAWQEYSRAATALRELGKPAMARLGFAESHAKMLEASVPKLRIHVFAPPESVSIALDGRPLSAAELEHEIALDPGMYELTVTEHAQRKVVKQALVAELGRTIVIPISATQSPDWARQSSSTEPALGEGLPAKRGSRANSYVPAAPAPRWPAPPSKLRPWAYTTGVAGVLGIGAGIALLMRARKLDQNSAEAADKAVQSHPRNAQLESQALRDYAAAVDTQRVGLVTGAAGAVALGASVYLFVKSSSSHGSRSPKLLSLTPELDGCRVNFQHLF